MSYHKTVIVPFVKIPRTGELGSIEIGGFEVEFAPVVYGYTEPSAVFAVFHMRKTYYATCGKVEFRFRIVIFGSSHIEVCHLIAAGSVGYFLFCVLFVRFGRFPRAVGPAENLSVNI